MVHAVLQPRTADQDPRSGTEGRGDEDFLLQMKSGRCAGFEKLFLCPVRGLSCEGGNRVGRILPLINLV